MALQRNLPTSAFVLGFTVTPKVGLLQVFTVLTPQCTHTGIEMSSNCNGKSCFSKRTLDTDACFRVKGFRHAVKRLRVVSRLMVREGLVKGPFNPSAVLRCDGLYAEWKEYVSGCTPGVRGRGERGMMLRDAYAKGTRSIFDFDCRRCSSILVPKAEVAWKKKVSEGEIHLTDEALLVAIQREARAILWTRHGDWWSVWRGEKAPMSRCPGRKGCLECRLSLIHI